MREKFRAISIKKAALISCLLIGSFSLFPQTGPENKDAVDISNKKVLILHNNNIFIPANRIVDAQLGPALNAAGVPTASIFGEYFDPRRFADTATKRLYLDYLSEFYSNIDLDLIIISEESTLDFTAEFKELFRQDAPVVLCAVTEGSPIPEALSSRATGNFKKLDIKKNIDNIVSLLPETKRIAVLIGTSFQDNFFEQFLNEYLENYNPALEIQILRDYSLETSLSIIKRLPRNSAVLAISVFADGEGVPFNPKDVVARVVQISPVPVFGISDTYLETGFVGGNLMSFNDLAADAADYAIKILKGTPLSEIPPKVFQNRDYFDWNELTRWRIPLSRLPENSIILNKPPSPWELYRGQILAMAALLLSGIFMIIALIIQLRKRKIAETIISEQKLELDRIIRTNPAMVYIYDIDNGNVEFANDKVNQVFGFDEEARKVVNFRNLKPIIHPEDYPKLKEQINIISKSVPGKERIYELDYRIKNRDNEWRWYHCAEAVFSRNHEKKAEKVIGSAIDITVQKREAEIINSSLSEKQTLLRELYHRTKNNMSVIQSLLNLYQPSLRDKKSREVFQDMANRIQAMSLVHQKLYQTKNLSSVNIRAYTEELILLTSSSFKSVYSEFNFKVSIGDIFLSINEAVPLGIFFNELITNSFRHADCDNLLIEIDLKKAKNKICIRYKDNGVGLPNDYDIEKKGGMGFKTLISLTSLQLNGKFELLSGPGFHCKLEFALSR